MTDIRELYYKKFGLIAPVYYEGTIDDLIELALKRGSPITEEELREFAPQGKENVIY